MFIAFGEADGFSVVSPALDSPAATDGVMFPLWSKTYMPYRIELGEGWMAFRTQAVSGSGVIYITLADKKRTPEF